MDKAKQQTVRLMLDDDELLVAACVVEPIANSALYEYTWTAKAVASIRPAVRGYGHSQSEALIDALQRLQELKR